MISEAEKIIETIKLEKGLTNKEIELVSGGAALSDHVAVALHKMYGYPLTLHLPCKWDLGKKAFFDTGVNDWETNPGGTANFYHRKFSQTMGRDESYSLESMDALIREKKITTSTSRGFHARNRKVAGSDVVIAFTWGETCPPPGGTAHTWSLVKGERIHICLSSLE